MPLQRIVARAPRGLEVDHIDRDPLNNQRSNLRLATHTENSRNKDAYNTNKSGFKGVSWCKEGGYWRAQVKHEGRVRTVATGDDPEKLARKYDEAVTELFGEFAVTNFPVDRKTLQG